MRILVLVLLSFLFFNAFSQVENKLEEPAADEYVPMRVIQCTAFDGKENIKNIYAGDDNTKWLATESKLYKINSADNATFQELDRNDWPLLLQNDGNFPLIVKTFDLERLPMSSNDGLNENQDYITTTFYNKKRKHLWVGTAKNGIFKYKIGDDVKFLKQYDASNSKLNSSYISAILVDKYDRTWIGTENGVAMIKDDKWKLYEDKKRIAEITALGPDVWIMSDGILYMVDEKNRWIPGDVDPRLSSGPIRDMTYDSDGNLWVASDIIVRYDIIKDKVEVFNSSNGFTGKNITRIVTDKDNALWVGTEEDGLFLIDREASMTVSCLIDNPLSCVGSNNDASLLVKVMGGSPPYIYDWDQNLSGPNPANVGPGLYSVTVKDQDGLIRKVSANIEDTRMQINIEKLSDAKNISSSDGVASVKLSGGVPPYDIVWSSGESGRQANQLDGGMQQVTISDAADCGYVGELDMGGQKTQVVTNELSLKFIDDGTSFCSNTQSRKVNVIVSGGLKPYTYKWHDDKYEGDEILITKGGEYTVTVTDANGKTRSGNYIRDEDPILLNVRQEQAVSSKRKRDGIAMVSAKGGSAPYAYEWSNGSSKSKVDRLIAGTYTVTVTDQDNCTAEGKVLVSQRINSALTSNKIIKGQTIPIKNLFYEANSSEISESSIPTLNEVYEFIQKNPKLVIEVGGHTNNQPLDEFCDRLSTERAKNIADYLVSRGISESQITYKGYGKRNPIATNNTKEGRKRNQRVELKVIEIN